MRNEAVITGYGAVTALGKTAEETFEALCEGRRGLRTIEGFDATAFECREASQIQGLNAESLDIAQRDARTMGFHSFSLIAAARQAHAAGRIRDSGIEPERIAFFTGMGMVDYRVDDLMPAMLRSRNQSDEFDYERFYGGAFEQVYPLWPLCTLNNMAQAQAAIDLDVRGDNTTFSPYGEAGAQALREAERSVWEDSAEAALAAGVSEQVSPQSLARHQRMGLLSPTSRLLPFGATRDGSVLGEGASAMAFEKTGSASKRGVEAQGTLPGYAMHYARGGKVQTLKRAITSAMVEALQMAGAGPEEVGVVYANGDGRVANDEAEAMAIIEVLGAKVPVTATKAALGNTLAAAAPLDAVLALLSLKRHRVPPCCLEATDLCAGVNLVLKECVPVHKPYALVNVQGQSGQCASILVRVSKE